MQCELCEEVITWMKMETSPWERVRGYKFEDIGQHTKVLGYIERVCLCPQT